MGRQGQLCGNPERYNRRTGQVTSADKVSGACFQPLPSLPARRVCLTNRGRSQKGRKSIENTASRAPFAVLRA
jgi:hypothetical protein